VSDLLGFQGILYPQNFGCFRAKGTFSTHTGFITNCCVMGITEKHQGVVLESATPLVSNATCLIGKPKAALLKIASWFLAVSAWYGGIKSES